MEFFEKPRRPFSRIGWGFFAMLLSAMAVQLGVLALVAARAPGFARSPWYIWVVNSLPLYMIGAPLCLLIVRGVPRVYIRNNKLPCSTLFICFAVSFTILYLGNLIGTGLNALLGLAKGGSVTDPLEAVLVGQDPGLVALFVVILGPVVEELLCRKLVIDRLAPFGDRTAIFVSALIFALIHGNFQQFFYALGIGLVFGYVYIRSGRIRYTIGLHMLINFCGGFLPLLFENVDPDALTSFVEGAGDLRELGPALLQTLFLGLYGMLSVILFLSGGALFFVFRKRIRLYPGDCCLAGRRIRTVILNPGMLMLLLVTILTFAISIFFA